MLTGLKRKISHFLHPIQGEIWCLHRVVDIRSEYHSNRELEITPDYLEDLIRKHKAEGFRFVSIDAMLGLKSITPKKRISISFDDGFRDIYTKAFPIFKKHKIPFTVYLTTDFPEGKADIWWIQLEKGRTIDEFEETMKAIYKSSIPMAEDMHNLTRTVPDTELSKSLSMTWDEIKEMADSGLCTIGSHSVSHPGLTRIGMEKCCFELLESKRIIKERLGLDAVHFSYPHSMQNMHVREAVAKAGYKSAALGYGGSIRKGADMYCLNRKYITQE